MVVARTIPRVAVRTSLLAVLVASGPLLGATGDDPAFFPAAQQRIAELTSVSASVNAAGAVSYNFAGYHPAIQGVVFTGKGSWNPATKKATEELVFPKGKKMQSVATCDGDPWADQMGCAPGSVSASSGAPVDLALLPYGAPVGAQLLSPQSHLKAKAAYAEGFKNRPVPTPTFTPTPHSHLTLQKSGGGVQALIVPTPNPKLGASGLRAAASVPTTAPSGPQYAAHYLPQAAPPAMKANQPAALQVRVENTSGRAWNLGWPASQAKVSVACRWFQGASAVGSPVRAPIGGTVFPGATTSPLVVPVNAPAQPGVYTLKWDLVEAGPGGEVWFSSKGVPTVDQPVTVTK